MNGKTNQETRCEDCLYFDWDEETDTDVCTLNLDEDELERFMSAKYSQCPYYRYYDEYKLVQKQN